MISTIFGSRGEARAGCGLKNRLREFSLIFAYVIFMVFRIYLCEKNIPHRDCSEMGAISKYVSNIAFFVWNILGKTLLFALNFDLKKTNSWNFEKLINDTCMGIVFILVRKKWGDHRWNIKENSENVLNVRRFDLRCSENKSKLLYSQNQS